MRKALYAVLLVIVICSFGGCKVVDDYKKRPLKKRYTSNQYPANGVKGLKSVGVVVLDASMEQQVDVLEFTKALHGELQQVEGLEVLPDAAVIAAAGQGGYLLPRDGLKLADALSADGVFVGIVTGYEPYGEPVVSMGLTLFSRATAPIRAIDIAKVVQGGRPLPMPEGAASKPVTAVFAVYDAGLQSVRERIRWFGEGRTSSEVGLGWERYYKVMPNYMRYVSYEMTWKLFGELEGATQGATP